MNTKTMHKTISGQSYGRTPASEITAALRRQILDAIFKPGERLRLEELRERFDAGMGPLRDALTRLASDGLVTLEEHKGYRVAPTVRAADEQFFADDLAQSRQTALTPRAWRLAERTKLGA